MDTIEKKLPPHSLEAEQAVIGAMIMDRDAIYIAMEMLLPRDFYNQHLKLVFEAISDLAGQNKPVDLITLQNYLENKGSLTLIGGVDYLSKLALATPTSANIKHYADIVKDKSILRRLIEASREIMANSYAEEEVVELILDDAESKIFNIIQDRDSEEFTPVKELVSPTIEKIIEAYKNQGSLTGLSTGFVDLNAMTSGFQPSDLILIAARPSMGKSAFALNIAQHVAIDEKKTVAIFSLEMSKDQLMHRMICSEARIDSQKIKNGSLTEAEWSQLLDSAEVLSNAEIYIDDTPGITIAELRAKCRKLKLEKGLDIVLIDYLQLMSGKSRSENRQQEISEISRGLKAVAREIDAPVVALSQLSRAVEARKDHRPMLSDLRESGAIEQDADIVMFLYRDEYYNPDSEKKGMAELIISKQRTGPTGVIDLLWLGQYTKFLSYDNR